MHLVRGTNAYRQIDATLTEETGGRFSLRIRVKPVSAAWHQRHTVHVARWRMSDPPSTLPAILELLAEQVADAAFREPPSGR